LLVFFFFYSSRNSHNIIIRKIVADKLNNDQQTTFQSYFTIGDSVVVSELLTDNEIMGISIYQIVIPKIMGLKEL